MKHKDRAFASDLASCVNTTPALMREEYNYPYLDPMPKPRTNADRIRSANDMELPDEILRFIYELCEDGEPDREFVVHWLRSEAKEASG